MSKKPIVQEPYWATLPRQHFGVGQTIGIVARHLIPLIGVLFLGWSAGQFLLLSVFNIAFMVSCTAAIGVAVSMRQEKGPSRNRADEIGSWLMLLAAGVIISLVLTMLFGWVIAIFAAAASPHGLFDRSMVWSVLAIVASAAPIMFQQYRADLRASLTEQERKQRDQPNLLVLLVCAGLMFLMSGFVANLGSYGLSVMVFAVTGPFIFRDLRPDLMREWIRPKKSAANAMIPHSVGQPCR